MYYFQVILVVACSILYISAVPVPDPKPSPFFFKFISVGYPYPYPVTYSYRLVNLPSYESLLWVRSIEHSDYFHVLCFYRYVVPAVTVTKAVVPISTVAVVAPAVSAVAEADTVKVSEISIPPI